MTDTGIIILAAGASSRLGRPKQLLLHRGQPLIVHLAKEASAAALQPIVIVTGAHAAAVHAALSGISGISIVHNEHWPTGMASSVVAGLTRALALQPDLRAVIVSVCDQPFLSAGLFRQLSAQQSKTHRGIVACAYGDTVGVPVLFTQPYFEPLLQLTGEAGAKKLLGLYAEDVTTVPFPQGVMDVDTEEDVAHLQNFAP